MAGFLKSIFRKGSPHPTPVADQPVPSASKEHTLNIATASLKELLAHIQAMTTTTVPLSLYIDVSKRCYEIALLDDDVSEKDRSSAWELAEAANDTIKQSISNDPDALASLHEARQGMIDRGRKFGYGSLVGKMRRNNIPPADCFRYAIELQNRALLEDYLEVVFSEGFTPEFRLPFVQELIWQNNYGIRNAVLILHGLAAKRDDALCKLFSKEEYVLLLRTPDDYASARAVLVNVGLLPTALGAKAFHSTPNLPGIVASLLRDKFQEADDELSNTKFSEADREILALTVRFLYLHLATSQLLQIFGNAIPTDMFATLEKPEVAQFRALFTSTYEDFHQGKLGPVPLDTTLISFVLNAADPSLSDEEFESKLEFIRSGTDWLNTKRVEFLEYFRFILRALSNPMPPVDSDVDKELLRLLARTYREKGARSVIAENAMNFEDWIGDKQED